MHHSSPSSTRRSRLRPLTLAILLAGSLASASASAAMLECGDERYVSGRYTMPSHDEALADCREQEAAMTHPRTGAYEAVSSCHDMAPPGRQGAWRHGRIGVDVVARDSGEPHTFEALWMCKLAVGTYDGGHSSKAE